MNDEHRIRQLEQICRSQQSQLDAQLRRLNQLANLLGSTASTRRG